jgi:hypothetical protein
LPDEVGPVDTIRDRSNNTAFDKRSTDHLQEVKETVTNRIATQPYFVSYPPTGATIGLGFTYKIECGGIDRKKLVISKGNDDTCGGRFHNTISGEGNYYLGPLEVRSERKCVLQVICSDGRNSVDQTVTVKINDKRARIADILPGPTALVGAVGSFRVRAAEQDDAENEISWALDPNGCPFAPVIDPGTGEITWICWAIGKCDINAVLLNHLSVHDRRSITIECKSIRSLKGPTSSACDDVVKVDDIVAERPFTCPLGTTFIGMGCKKRIRELCGPQISISDSLFPGRFSNLPIRLLNSFEIRNYDRSRLHGFSGSWDVILQHRGEFHEGVRTGVWTWAGIQVLFNKYQVFSYKLLEGRFRAGKPECTWTSWHSNGKKATEGSYLEGRPFGLWKWWNGAGELLHEQTFIGNEKLPYGGEEEFLKDEWLIPLERNLIFEREHPWVRGTIGRDSKNHRCP